MKCKHWDIETDGWKVYCRDCGELMNEMKIYLVEFDNDEKYSDAENYSVGVFDTFVKAENYCILKGYEKTETDGLYKKKREGWFGHYAYLSINEVVINEVICEAE